MIDGCRMIVADAKAEKEVSSKRARGSKQRGANCCKEDKRGKACRGGTRVCRYKYVAYYAIFSYHD